MGKTFEALERSKKESGKKNPDVSEQFPERDAASFPEKLKQEDGVDTLPLSEKPLEGEILASTGVISNPIAVEHCYELRTNLLTRWPDESFRSILFAGTSPGDGSSTLATNYATLLSQDPRERVLLLDLDGEIYRAHKGGQIDRSQSPTKNLVYRGKETFEIKRVGPGNLYLLLSARENGNHTRFLESDRIDEFLKMVYGKFDRLVVATPAMSSAYNARPFCAKVDGTILIILSGKTRRQIAIRVKEAIEDAGGRLLGVVLNRRKHYIPESIYRRL